MVNMQDVQGESRTFEQVLLMEPLLFFILFLPGEILSKSPSSLEPRHLSMLLSLLQRSPNPTERKQVLITLGNAAAFTVNQVLHVQL